MESARGANRPPQKFDANVFRESEKYGKVNP
jgi:hypothetical protein